MTLDELINLAQEQGICLGKNPKRTLRYYVSRGLMSPPQIEYEGKTKKAVYSLENLVKYE